MSNELSPEARVRVSPARVEVEYYQDNGRWHAVRPVWWRRNLYDSFMRFEGVRMPRSAYLVPNSKARIVAMLVRLAADGFLCQYCGERIPFYKNANSRFCGPQCYQEATKRRRSPNKER
ncbi:hypothetical protein [Ruegeria arenilitoris]|uniref:hypothetical protein n=1 Tax=Ruegeria arenilitoris TaxID=1173585 RepID=UPI00147C691E|nr:hypothetical protein [Ruegeria arenilitoris]